METDFVELLALFRATYGRRPIHGREFRHWVNSPEGQTILIRHGVECRAKEDDEIAEEEAAEDNAPRNILIRTVAAAVGMSNQSTREEILWAISQWEQSIGDELAVMAWAKSEQRAGALLLELIYGIHSACSPDDPTASKPNFRLVE